MGEHELREGLVDDPSRCLMCGGEKGRQRWVCAICVADVEAWGPLANEWARAHGQAVPFPEHVEVSAPATEGEPR